MIDDEQEFINNITDTKESFRKIASAEIDDSEAQALAANEEHEHAAIKTIHNFARALNDQPFGLLVTGEEDDFTVAIGGGISPLEGLTGDFQDREPFIFVDLQKCAALLGFKTSALALEVWVGPQDWGTDQKLPIKLLTEAASSWGVKLREYGMDAFYFDEPEPITYWSAVMAGKGCLHPGLLDVLDVEGVALEACEEPWEEIDPTQLIRELNGVSNTLGAVDEECISGALNLVNESGRILLPVVNILGPNDDYVAGIAQRFSLMCTVDEKGIATDFFALMSAWRS